MLTLDLATTLHLLQALEDYLSIQDGVEGFPPTSEIFVPAWVTLNGTIYCPRMVLFVSYTSDSIPEFVMITSIAMMEVIINSVVNLLVQK